MEPQKKKLDPGFGDDLEAREQKEGPLARGLESQTSKLPSDVWLWASVGSMLVSLGLQLSGNRKTKDVSNFIGQWAPTLLILGLYNKVVKVAGHDRTAN
jgi:hypothetical protein